MIIFAIRDLGTNFWPTNLNNNDDVVGYSYSQAQPSVVLADGTLLGLPAQVTYAADISDNGVVLGYLSPGDPASIDIGTMSVNPVSLPGFPALGMCALNKDGDLVGSAGRSLSITDDWRGFILNRQTSSITWVLPTIPAPSGGTAFLELHDLNSQGHAVGVQGWVKGLGQQEVPVFYNGATVVNIGSPGFIENGIRITEDDRMRVLLDGVSPSGNAIYDGKTDSLTPFVDSLSDLNKLGWILWEDSSGDSYLTYGPSTRLEQLVPGSGWTNMSASHMNDVGSIAGVGKLGGVGQWHGFIITATFLQEIREVLVAQILFGIINDAGGVFVIGGHGHRVPPWGPLRELLAALPARLRKELDAAIAATPLRGPADANAFALNARRIVAQYQRQIGRADRGGP